MIRYVGKTARLLRELRSLADVTDVETYGRFVKALATGIPHILRTRNLEAPHQALWGTPTVFKVEGLPIALDGKWFGYAQEIYARRVYWPDPEFLPRAGMKVLDAGASGGIYTLAAAVLGAEVIAVEAKRESYEALVANVERNRCSSRVHAHWAMVGTGTGMLADSGIRDSYLGTDVPPTLSVAELMQKHGFDHLDLVKVDIEGSEFDLALRDNAWLDKTDRVAMEIEWAYGDIDQVAAMFEGKGFEVSFYDLDSRRVPKITGPVGYVFAKRRGK